MAPVWCRWRALVPVMLVVAAACAGSAGSEADPTVAPPVSSGPTRTAPTSTAPTSTAPSATSPGATVGVVGVVPDGFDAVAAVVTDADGEECALCVWLARTPDQRGRGLMGVTDLGGADGMVFLFGEPTTGRFWMRDTPMPLSIAFFGADGAYVSSADMVPCLDGAPADCPRYAAASAYTAAIEVPSGQLPDFGAGAGSRLEVLATPCDPAATR